MGMTVVGGYSSVVQAVSDLGLCGNEALAAGGWIAAKGRGRWCYPAGQPHHRSQVPQTRR